MQQMATGPEQSDQDDDTEFDDIELEMWCSAREASLGFVSFANLDLTRAALEWAQIRAGMVCRG